MGVTISTHNRSMVAREHNIRNPKVVTKEEHIDLSRPHEIWHDEKLSDAYERIFGAAVERYNQRQTRSDRKISNYLAAVTADANKHPVYEMIIGVYGSDCSTDTKREILREFVDGWKERNPNLEMVGAYYHDDEESKDPHVHIDYVPVAHGYQRGMDTQNGLVKALGEQGIEGGKTMKETAQILWEKRENEHLEKLCNNRGLTVEHPGKGRKHLDTPEYKELQDELHAARTELQETHQKVKEGLQEVLSVSRSVAKQKQEAKELTAHVEQKQQELQERRETIEELDGFIEGSRDEIHAYEERIGELQGDYQDLQERKQELQDVSQKLQETRQELGTVKGGLEGLRAEETALEAKISDLRAEHDFVRKAIKEDYERGDSLFGPGWQQKVKDGAEKQKRLQLLEKFVEHPQIKPLWEKFCAAMEKHKTKKRTKSEHTHE